jgi:hypothetical protein
MYYSNRDWESLFSIVQHLVGYLDGNHHGTFGDHVNVIR